jgi:hypothetical protein
MFHVVKKIALLSLLLASMSCSSKKADSAKDTPIDSNPPAQTTTENNTTPTPPTPEPVDGSSFNKFFPKTEGNFEVVFTQEKDGFAQAKLKKDGKEVATLTVSDVVKNAEAVTDYAASSKQLGGFPAVAKGNLGTAVLVANRFQVQVRSKDKTFGEADREQWLQKFDLNTIARIK